MFTRLTWNTFSPLFASAAKEVLDIRETDEMMARTRVNYGKIITTLPEVSLSGQESYLRLITAIFLASLMSMEEEFTEEQIIAYYEKAVLQHDMTLRELSRLAVMKNLCAMSGGLAEMFSRFDHGHLNPIIYPLAA